MMISFVVYRNLPIEVTRQSEIQLGNKLIENIHSYKIENNKLPDNDDVQTLEHLGFEIAEAGTKPSYICNQNGEYEIVFLKGFDGPYLMWNSKEQEWKVDAPTIFQ